MKCDLKLCFTFVVILTLISCSEKNSLQEIDASLTTASEVISDETNITEAEHSSSQLNNNTELVNIYTKFLSEKLEKDDYFYVIGGDAVDMGLSSIIALCDIDFDGVPELFAGQHDTRGHGIYSVYSGDGIVTDYISCGICNLFVSAGNSCYSSWGNLAAQESSWLKFSEDTPKISVKGLFEDENSKVNVTVTLNDKENNYNDITYADVDNIFEQEFGISYTELQNSTDSLMNCTIGHLIVSDPENYTEADIYNCLASLLSEYEKQAKQ